MKPELKPPGTKRLKLFCDDPLSTFAFEYNLRRYNLVTMEWWSQLWLNEGQGLTLVRFSAQLERFVWDRGCA